MKFAPLLLIAALAGCGGAKKPPTADAYHLADVAFRKEAAVYARLESDVATSTSVQELR